VSTCASSSSYKSSVTYPVVVAAFLFASNTAQPSVKQ
jgi:hypothetical protein